MYGESKLLTKADSDDDEMNPEITENTSGTSSTVTETTCLHTFTTTDKHDGFEICQERDRGDEHALELREQVLKSSDPSHQSTNFTTATIQSAQPLNANVNVTEREEYKPGRPFSMNTETHSHRNEFTSDRDESMDNSSCASVFSDSKRGSQSRIRNRLIQVVSSPVLGCSTNMQSTSPVRFEKLLGEESKKSILPVTIGTRKAPSLTTSSSQIRSSTLSNAQVYILNLLIPSSDRNISHETIQMIRIHLRVSAVKEAKDVDVEFDYDLTSDDPYGVASEMRECEDLAGIDISQDAIVNAIDPVVKCVKKCVAQLTERSETTPPLIQMVISEILENKQYAGNPCFYALNAILHGEPAPLTNISSIARTQETGHSQVKCAQDILDSNRSVKTVIASGPTQPIALCNGSIDSNNTTFAGISPNLRQQTTIAANRNVSANSNLFNSKEGGVDEDVIRVLESDIDDSEDENDAEYNKFSVAAKEIISK